MKIPITKKLIVVFAMLSLSTITLANKQAPPAVVVHPADKVKVGNARLELGYKCEASTECYSSCCIRNRCSDIKACRKPKGMFS